MKSVMQHSFSNLPQVEIPRSSFDRSFAHKTTFDAGLLIPIFLDEGLPGDSFNVNLNAFARLATPVNPIMDNMKMDVHYWAVPKRLVWDNFVKMMGEQENPGDSIDFETPLLASFAPPAPESLSDYFGLPTNAILNGVHCLFHRAYNLIWNEWYRDQNLQDALPVPKGDGPDPDTNYAVQRRGKRKDYFTSALPWPQKPNIDGGSVQIPLGTSAPIVGFGPLFDQSPTTGGTVIKNSKGQNEALTNYFLGSEANIFASKVLGGAYPDITADLSSATASTINELRQAFQVQRMLERDARGGTRYTELIKSHFGVTSPDARLQRPEYLGGGTANVIVSPIAQTSSTDETTPQGNLSAVGTVSMNGVGFTKSFTEHTLIIGLVSVRADLTYQQGLPRMFSRSTRYDYYWPTLSHLGEQPILNKEIYYQNNPSQDNAVFGYQERYAEYRYKPSMITGKFRSTFAQPLDSWHLSQEFTELPALNETFIQEDPPVDRVIAVQDEPHFIFDSFTNMRCARPMPLYGVPGLIDHF